MTGKPKSEVNYYDLYYTQKDHVKLLQRELTKYRKYGHIVRAIKYILAYSERKSIDELINIIKQQITYK